MKKKNMIIFVQIIVSLIFSMFVTSCYKSREKNYYIERSNYITEEAVVENIIYDEDQQYIVLWLSEIDDLYQDTSFIIRGENSRIAINNGILEKIQVKDEIIFTSAPKYFGDGYFMPVVHISIDDNVILSFEDGYSNLMESYK